MRLSRRLEIVNFLLVFFYVLAVFWWFLSYGFGLGVMFLGALATTCIGLVLHMQWARRAMVVLSAAGIVLLVIDTLVLVGGVDPMSVILFVAFVLGIFIYRSPFTVQLFESDFQYTFPLVMLVSKDRRLRQNLRVQLAKQKINMQVISSKGVSSLASRDRSCLLVWDARSQGEPPSRVTAAQTPVPLVVIADEVKTKAGGKGVVRVDADPAHVQRAILRALPQSDAKPAEREVQS